MPGGIRPPASPCRHAKNSFSPPRSDDARHRGKLYHHNIMTVLRESGSAYGLAFETSSALGSIALGRGSRVLAVRRFSGPRRHAVDGLQSGILSTIRRMPSMKSRLLYSELKTTFVAASMLVRSSFSSNR